MSTIHLVGGEKGGVGKSVVARLLAQRFIDRDQKFAAIDADASHGALLRYYGEYAQQIDLESYASSDQIMDRALGADRHVLVDLPAQSARLLKRWMEAGDVLGFAQEMGVSCVFWHVTDGGFDSVGELARVEQMLGSQVSMVIVKNYGRSPDFSQLEASAAFQSMVEGGARVVDLPALDSSTMYEIDRFGSSFWAAVNCTEGEWVLSPMARRRARRWLEESQNALNASGIF